MRDPEDLSEVWDTVEVSLAARGLGRFPGHIELGIDATTATWDDTYDLDGFLDFALSLGAHPIYATKWEFSLEDLKIDADEFVDAWYQQLEALARPYLGVTWLVGASFAHNGIVHNWSRRVEWIDTLQAKAAELTEATRFEREVLLRAAISEQAEQLARHSDYPRMNNHAARRSLARALFADLDDEQVLSEVVDEAERKYQEFVRPVLEKDLVRRAIEMIDDGETHYAAAAKLDVSRETLRTLLAKYGGDMTEARAAVKKDRDGRRLADEARRLMAEGLPQYGAAAKLGISRDRLRGLLYKYEER